MNERVVEEVKSRIDLAELIASYGVDVRRNGSSVKACCPFHAEKTPSFNINVNKGFYHCFGCGESGDAISFVMKQEGLAFPDALKKLAEQVGVKVDLREDPEAEGRKRLYALMAELAAFYHRCLLKIREAETARAYLKTRELSDEIAEKWIIGYAPNGIATILTWAEKHGFTPRELEAAGVIKAATGPGDRGYHRFGGRLMFTIADARGRVVAFSGRQLVERKNSGKYVNSPETGIFTKGKVLFGFDKAAAAIAKSREVIVCEGQIDCIRLHASGFTNAVAGQGTAFTADHVKALARVADAAVLVYDDDAAGHKATVRSARLLLAAGLPVRVVSLPDGEDPDSYLRKHGEKAFAALVKAAESIVAFQVRTERAKEDRPESIDAVNRVSKAILLTLAESANSVLKASLLAEAARLLALPLAALGEELSKLKSSAVSRASASAADEPDEPVAVPEDEVIEDPAIPGMDAAAAEPPSGLEFAFMQFLMANERVRDLDALAGEFLTSEVFAHGFTWRFLSCWRLECAEGSDRDEFAVFAESLGPVEREWFDRVVIASDRSRVSTLRPAEILEDFICRFWIERLKRLRGTLAATGDPAADGRRMEISSDLKRLALVKWNSAKDILRKYLG